MAGDWLKFEKSTSDKPEVWAMADDLGIDPDAVVGKLLRVWAWFDEQSEEGNAPSVSKSLLDRRVGVTGFCDSMVLCGWMVDDGKEVTLPNFDRHNGQTAKNRALTAKRVAKHKQKTNDGGNDSVTQTPLPREEKRREEKNKEIDIVISYLNDASGKRFRGAKLDRDAIGKRLEEYGMESVKLVIDKKAATWKNDPKMQAYLRPSTLFRPSNFDAYLNESGGRSVDRHSGFNERDYSEGINPDAKDNEPNF